MKTELASAHVPGLFFPLILDLRRAMSFSESGREGRLEGAQ